MSQEETSDSKPHEPTEKRLRDARKKGDVPSSRETGNMMVVLSLLGITIFVLPWQSADLAESLAILIDNSGRISVGTGQAGVTRLGEVMFEFMIALGFVLAPIFGLLALGGLFGVMIQGETVFSLERITPKLNKISPQQGFKRLFSGSALIEFGKSLLKVFVAGALALWVTNKVVAGMMDSSGFLPESLPNYLLEAARRLLVAMSIFLIPLALLDIVWRRFEWRKKHMMSHKELRDEMKEAEGSPELKAKRAQVRREQSQKRVALAVPEASVVLTNPTHYAVALKYEPGTDLAPQCVAKGADHMAKRIRELAFDNEIPVVENKPLARLLYDTVDLDEVVPVEHWAVVAEIISFVLDLENNVHRQPPDGSSLRTLADE
ncbi:flagellar biosynthesis protein FlhB [Pelagimonas sp. KU-00592-HH]|jgi:flagellar biosynthetic protein FlhB|uniref:EscU/YscU/HrcU family type III secretion system export apparatus switch protein n=1 Tax=Roseobacteraceae TaxID=2854170 RepID=UPI0020CC9EFB|nr:flagellar type III secretion system protein FlhB [Shimia sp. CNT1-13L.2]MCP9481075.1 flagellar type III secretion system protein FlhB [Shimia sp. CNT1-13L.2]